MAMRNRLFLVAALATAALLASCSSATNAPAVANKGGLGGSCPLYKVPAKTDITSPTSLKNDVIPIFAQNCAQTKACHAASGARAFLSGDASMVHAAIVNVASVQLSTMPYVTAGDASKSYLMHKMDGDQCYFDPQCLGEFCQGSMPSSALPLDVGQRDIIRRWIDEGAKDN